MAATVRPQAVCALRTSKAVALAQSAPPTTTAPTAPIASKPHIAPSVTSILATAVRSVAVHVSVSARILALTVSPVPAATTPTAQPASRANLALAAPRSPATAPAPARQASTAPALARARRQRGVRVAATQCSPAYRQHRCGLACNSCCQMIDYVRLPLKVEQESPFSV